MIVFKEIIKIVAVTVLPAVIDLLVDEIKRKK